MESFTLSKDLQAVLTEGDDLVAVQDRSGKLLGYFKATKYRRPFNQAPPNQARNGAAPQQDRQEARSEGVPS